MGGQIPGITSVSGRVRPMGEQAVPEWGTRPWMAVPRDDDPVFDEVVEMNEPTKIVCLCCAAEYPVEGDCPNTETLPHSVELAIKVASYLRERGCEHPRPLDVRSALAALDAEGRT